MPRLYDVIILVFIQQFMALESVLVAFSMDFVDNFDGIYADARLWNQRCGMFMIIARLRLEHHRGEDHHNLCG